MKNILLFLAAVFGWCVSTAAEPNLRRVVGQYTQGNEALVVFDDAKYVFFSDGDLTSGRVEATGKNKLTFVPDPLKDFAVYGRRNKHFVSGAQFAFFNFDARPCFFGIDSSLLYTVFEPGARSDRFMSFYDHSAVPDSVRLLAQNRAITSQEGQYGALYSLANTERYNDFVMIFLDPPASMPQRFEGEVLQNGRSLLVVANDRSAKMRKGKIDPQIAEWRSKLKEQEQAMEGLESDQFFFANAACRPAYTTEVLDPDQYAELADEPGTYVHLTAFTEDGSYDMGNPTEANNFNVVYRYTIVEPTENYPAELSIDHTRPMFEGQVRQAADLDEVPDYEREALAKIGELKTTLAEFEEAAAQGLDTAQEMALCRFKIAEQYDELGEHAQAFEWCAQAAEGGWAEAQHRLARYYEHGLGTECDLAQAVAWYARAAQDGNGYLPAVEAMARCYWDSSFDGENEDLERQRTAFEWYNKAAARGSVDAKVWVAGAYLNGWGVEADPVRYLELVRELVEQDGRDNLYAVLGSCYASGIGTEQDWNKAFEWFELGYEAGDPTATYNLGVAYHMGRGVEVDYGRAFELFSESDDEDCLVLQALGECYLNGQGVKKDLKRAANYYKESLDAIEWSDQDQDTIDQLRNEIDQAFEGPLRRWKPRK